MKRFDVRLRLGATFCLLAAVIIVIGWQGVHHLRYLNREIQDVIYDRWTEEQMVREAYHLSDLNSRITLSIFLIDDQDEIIQRRLNDDRTFRIIKNFIDPQTMDERLETAGRHGLRLRHGQQHR